VPGSSSLLGSGVSSVTVPIYGDPTVLVIKP
jgi:hypothetical protein